MYVSVLLPERFGRLLPCTFGTLAGFSRVFSAGGRFLPPVSTKFTSVYTTDGHMSTTILHATQYIVVFLRLTYYFVTFCFIFFKSVALL